MRTKYSLILRIVLVSCVLGAFLVSGGITPAAAQVVPPIIDPTPGSTLTTATVTFTGGHTSEGEQHWAYVGDYPGGNNYFAGAPDANHQFTVSGLPSTGTIYVRYYTRPSPSSAWENQTHSYTMNVGSVTALTITPTTATVGVGGQQMFTGVGGVPGYTFSVVADTSGGATIHVTTGLYTAGPNEGASTVRVTDANQNTADAGVTVTGGDPSHPTLRWDRKLDSTNGSTAAGFEGCDSDRFKCIFEGTAVVDMETGLVWERFPEIAFGTSSWSQAISRCAIREVGGRKGWSLPLREQLASLVDMTGTGVDMNGFSLKLPDGNPFVVWSGGYYSATVDAEDPTLAWGVRFTDGAIVDYSKSYPNSHVWCVRGGQVYDGQHPNSLAAP